MDGGGAGGTGNKKRVQPGDRFVLKGMATTALNGGNLLCARTCSNGSIRQPAERQFRQLALTWNPRMEMDKQGKTFPPTP